MAWRIANEEVDRLFSDLLSIELPHFDRKTIESLHAFYRDKKWITMSQLSLLRKIGSKYKKPESDNLLTPL